MRFHHACIESIATALPDEKWTSAAIEERLKPLYDRLKLPAGRLEERFDDVVAVARRITSGV